MAGFIEYETYDATGLAALIAGGQVSAAEVLDAAIERAERLQPSINGITIPLYEHARAAAHTGLPAGPLSGVPFLLKDLGAQLSGTRTSGSGKLWRDFVADHDSTLVARYRAAGLNIFGKSASPEMGLAPSTEPAMYGPCRNPWNLAYSAGGSSGGSAAAVAARILPMAHATDGGGSIRIPASACGLFGLKTTRARNPSGPDVGEGWGGQAVAHCVNISVRDSAALLDVSAGPDIGDPYWAPPPAGRFVDEVERAPGRLRIALCVTPWNGAGRCRVPAVGRRCRTALREPRAPCRGRAAGVRYGRLPRGDAHAGGGQRAGDLGDAGEGSRQDAGGLRRGAADLVDRRARAWLHSGRLCAVDHDDPCRGARSGALLRRLRHSSDADDVFTALADRRAVAFGRRYDGLLHGTEPFDRVYLAVQRIR